MGGIGASVGAVVLCLAGGAMNCTWPLFSKPESPDVIRVASPGGWEWENVWLIFTMWSTLLNVFLCVGVVGPSTLMDVYNAASASDLSLVCVFGFLWGSGTMCYSLGVQMLGAGPGIALVMSLLVVIGTLLPLIEDHADNAGSPAALVTMLGLVFAISGFVTSAFSSRLKDQAKMAAARGAKGSSAVPASTDPEIAATAGVHLADGSAAMESTITPSSGRNANGNDSRSLGSKNRTGNSSSSGCIRNAIHEADGADNGHEGDGLAQEICGKDGLGGHVHHKSNHLTGVAVCVTGAIMSSMLQFSFVYGEPLIEQAEEEEGVPEAVAPMVVWLIAFSFAGLWNVIYAWCLLSAKGTWGRYRKTRAGDLINYPLRLTVMSLFFIGHIHMYGIAQFLFGGLGPVIAWPLLMSSTVLGGQLWGVFMKEWVEVPARAVRVNILSISLLVTAVTVIAVAGAVL